MATAPVLKNKRLADRDRAALYNFAKRQIEATQDRAELNAAYDAAADAVHAEIARRWPQNEMKVLAKHDCAALDPCVYVSSPESAFNYDEFCFRDKDKRIALRPSRTNCRRQPIGLDGEAGETYARYLALKKADAAQVATRLNDFKALIYNTANFNALAEAWPAIEVMRGEIVGSGAALSILSNEVRERLQADPAMALAA